MDVHTRVTRGIYLESKSFLSIHRHNWERKVDLRPSPPSLRPVLPFLFEEFDISSGSVVGVGAVGGACGCDRSTAATEESIRGGSCRTG